MLDKPFVIACDHNDRHTIAGLPLPKMSSSVTPSTSLTPAASMESSVWDDMDRYNPRVKLPDAFSADSCGSAMGQMFIMGFEGTEVTPQIRTLIEKHHLGTILLTAKNLKCWRSRSSLF